MAPRSAPRSRPRIVAGDFGGRRLQTPPGLTTRPTSDRVKEALFSLLGPPSHEPPEPFRVLDLFAGSGALGLEALSRGAGEAVLVDSDRHAAEVCADNVRELGLERRARVLARDAGDVLRDPRALGGRFDWVFLDPPYAGGALDRALRLVAGSGALAEGGLVIAEHDAKEPPPDRYPGPRGALVLHDRRRWGDTAVSIYREEAA